MRWRSEGRRPARRSPSIRKRPATPSSRRPPRTTFSSARRSPPRATSNQAATPQPSLSRSRTSDAYATDLRNRLRGRPHPAHSLGGPRRPRRPARRGDGPPDTERLAEPVQPRRSARRGLTLHVLRLSGDRLLRKFRPPHRRSPGRRHALGRRVAGGVSQENGAPTEGTPDRPPARPAAAGSP